MTVLKAQYSSLGAGTGITITSAATLANLGAAGCVAIDNTSNLYLDAMMMLQIGIASGTIAQDKLVNIWFALSEDATNYTGTTGASLDNYVGSDASVTLQNPTLFRGPFVIPVQNSNLTVKAMIPSVIKYIGGIVLPKKWGLIVENRCGLPFASFSAEYTGLNYQGV